jgi:signal transduction histidine kinase
MIIQSMLGMVRDQTKNRREVKISAIVNDCFQTMARNLKNDRIEIELDIPEDLAVYTIPSQLQQVLLNLIINARQAMLDTGGALTIGASETGDGNVQITVNDSGCGIEPNCIDKIFEPFFTTKANADKPDQQGTGLGLSVCKNIIQSHGGTIEVNSRPAEGTTFIIKLPIKGQTPKDKIR